jgi:transcriptional regulator with XRE-family HTH domain
MALRFRPDRIRQLREGLGLTRAEFARRIQVSRQMVAFYEEQGATPGTDVLMRLIDLTGAKMESFFVNDADSPSVRGRRVTS